VPDTTRLGRAIIFRDMRVYEVSAMIGVHPRTMTEYVAGRKVITEDHLRRLSEALRVEVELLREPLGFVGD